MYCSRMLVKNQYIQTLLELRRLKGGIKNTYRYSNDVKLTNECGIDPVS